MGPILYYSGIQFYVTDDRLQRKECHYKQNLLNKKNADIKEKNYKGHKYFLWKKKMCFCKTVFLRAILSKIVMNRKISSFNLLLFNILV